MSHLLLTSAFWNNPIVIIVGLILLFGIIALGVFLVRKYTKFFKSDEGPKSDAEIAEEELNRILVDVEDEDTKAEMEQYVREAAKKSKKEAPPTPEEAAAEEVARVLEPVTDKETAKAMEEYKEEHPEEEEQHLGSKEGE